MLNFKFALYNTLVRIVLHSTIILKIIIFLIIRMNFKLEICVDSVQSAIYAEQSGASRIELCDNLMEGGTTPSFGIISTARKYLKIGLNVLIRPRPGDFLYSEQEFEIMLRETEICRECGVDGIVTGILRSDGAIDTERTSELVRAAHPMPVTFHRAYDMCIDPIQGLEDIIKTGARRVLTSGHKNSAEDGSVLLGELVRVAGQRIIIMPGSGINETNIEKIARVSGAREFHCSARKIIESDMSFRKEGVTMGNVQGYDEFRRKVADSEKIKNIIRILANL
jgi:copper homeostasis protein